MRTLVGKNIIRFIFLVLLQGLVISHIPLPLHLQLFVSVLFILFLPFGMRAWLGLLFGFLCGLCVDTLTGTWGMHAAAATTAAFVRELYTRFNERYGREAETETVTPTLSRMGLPDFSAYAAVVILSYHLVFFALDSFQLWDFPTFGIMLGSALLCYICAFLSQKWFAR